jgi:hypothetical protein
MANGPTVDGEAEPGPVVREDHQTEAFGRGSGQMGPVPLHPTTKPRRLVIANKEHAICPNMPLGVPPERLRRGCKFLGVAWV